MRLLLLTPLPSPFVAQPLELLSDVYPDLEVQPVFYADASHRPTWGEMSWQGIWLNGTYRERLKALSRVVDHFKPQQVVLGQYTCSESWWLKRYAARHQLPTHVFFLEPLIPCGAFKYAVKLALFKRFLRGVQSLGCMGRRAHADYSSIYKGHIFSCPYAFDLSGLKQFDGSERRRNCTTFLYSGRLSAFRDPLLVVRCFARLRERSSSEVHLIISGTGDLQAAVTAEIEVKQLGSQVTWMNDFKDWEDIRNLYRYADVLLSLGVYNTWSLTIQEAMAAGMGIVATRTTEAANELLVNNYNGYLVDHGNPNGIVDSMLRYIEDPELAKLHGARSREIARVVDAKQVAMGIAEALNL